MTETVTPEPLFLVEFCGHAAINRLAFRSEERARAVLDAYETALSNYREFGTNERDGKTFRAVGDSGEVVLSLAKATSANLVDARCYAAFYREMRSLENVGAADSKSEEPQP